MKSCRQTVPALPAALFLVLALAGCRSTSSRAWSAYESGDFVAAQALWLPLAEDGDRDAQFFVGVIHDEGRGVAADPEEAKRWYALSADQGYPPAQYNLALLHLRADEPERAVELLTAAAEQEHARAQTTLATLYREGIGVEADAGRAESWLSRAARNGGPEAQFELGQAYLEGAGVERNRGQAREWFERAAEGGSAAAQLHAGQMAYLGEGGPQDVELALARIGAAAEQGLVDAQAAFGLLLLQEGRDAEEAARWLQVAAEAGHAQAQYNLGVLHTKGAGVELSRTRAIRWLELAAEQGVELAFDKLEMLRRHGRRLEGGSPEPPLLGTR